MIPNGELVSATYENLLVKCPSSNARTTLNRISDLGDVQPVASRNLVCPECGKTLQVSGDTVNPPHEILILDCHDLLAEKPVPLSNLQDAKAAIQAQHGRQ